MSLRFCTIANAGHLPHARVLARGLAEHHPGARLTVLRLGANHAPDRDEPFDVLGPEELGGRGWEKLLADRRWADLTELLKPQLLTRMIDEGARAAVYLDAAVDVRAPLDPVMRELRDHRAALAPRVLESLPTDGHRPGPGDLRRAGRLGASLVAIAGNERGTELLGWWTERIVRTAASLPARPGVDSGHAARELSRWADLAPSRFRATEVLSDPGSPASYWNLHEGRLASENGSMTVDGRRLRLFHFEGFDPSRPFLLGGSADRIRPNGSPALADLCESYAARLVGAGWRDHRRRSEVGLRLPNGLTFDDRLSHLLAEAAASGETFGDIFTPEGAEAFMRWLEAPAAYGAESGVSRYLYGVYRERDDLHLAYPDLDGADGEGFAGWAWVFGVVEMGIPERFLPPLPANFEGRIERERAAPRRPRDPLPRGPRPDLSLNVTGLLTGTLGLGEAARGYVRALEAARIPVSTHTVDERQFVKLSETTHESYARVEYHDLDGAASSGFKLICINPDELPRFAETVGERFFTERPAIGVWAWETDHVPERWERSFGLLDEIWVYSSYVAENLGRAADVPVKRIPPPVSPPDPGDVELDLGVPDGFRFLFMFDFFSTIQRKNPVGAIDAFRQAFAPDEGPQLVIKTINGVHRPEALEEVLWAARGRGDVHVVDRSLSERERDALVAGCDCYVSLHRSEGFGLTLAECMALGKPVIATAFSATTDFMTEENSYLVPYEMTRVGADCEIYPAEGTWADPDAAEAARFMRTVVDRPDEARTKGERARRDIERMYSPAASGELIRAELERMIALWPEGARAAAP